MKKRYVVLALASILALALAIPALGGPSNPVADVTANAKKTAKKALKKAKKANKAAKSAQSSAASAQGSADSAQSAASANATKLTCSGSDVYVSGACLETTLRPGATHPDAQTTCLGEGKRLLSIAERQQAGLSGKIPFSQIEWTNVAIDGNAIIVDDSAGGGKTLQASVGLTLQYRCATAPAG